MGVCNIRGGGRGGGGFNILNRWINNNSKTNSSKTMLSFWGGSWLQKGSATWRTHNPRPSLPETPIPYSLYVIPLYLLTRASHYKAGGNWDNRCAPCVFRSWLQLRCVIWRISSILCLTCTHGVGVQVMVGLLGPSRE